MELQKYDLQKKVNVYFRLLNGTCTSSVLSAETAEHSMTGETLALKYLSQAAEPWP